MKDIVKLLVITAAEWAFAGACFAAGAKAANEVSNLIVGKSNLGKIEVNMKNNDENKG